jgi:tetratricopeptide (TPR) repeat protein
MFNWLKKPAEIAKAAPAPDIAAIPNDDSHTPPGITESVALKNQGNAHFGNGKLEDAAACYRRAIELNPNHAEACNNLGFVFQAQGKLEEAVALYRQAVTLDPDLLMAHMNLGFGLINLGRADAAEESLRRVIALAPGHAIALQSLGVIAAQRGDFPDAEAMLRRALELQPDYAEALNNLGSLLMQTRRLPEAETCYRRALELQPDHAEALNNLGQMLAETGRLPEAEAAYRRALELKPDFAHAHNNLGLLLAGTGRLPEAEASYRRALNASPGLAEGHYNLGNLLVESKRMPDAEASLRRALELKPDYAKAHNNLGNLLKETGRLPEAEASYRRTLELNPDFAEAHLNLGLLLLSRGRYSDGWPHYEYRYHRNRIDSAHKAPDLPYPQWRGESLAGKSLAICPEQGFGDYIQLARYFPLLRERGVSRLTLVCHPALKALLEAAEGVDAVITDLAQLARHDYWTLPLSLPLHFGTTVDTIPAVFPYLYAPPVRVEHWRNRLPAGRFRVGLVWKGSAIHKNDSNRSLPGLRTLAPLWSVPGVEFISLQKGQGEDEAKQPPAGQPIVPLGSDIADFADTAAIVSQLDLVICVDTAIAHVAGALNTPCWVLLPAYGTDWRWLRDREDSPWYASMRLFRQQAPDDWEQPVEHVREALMACTHAGIDIPMQ